MSNLESLSLRVSGHEAMQTAFLLALLSTHPEPERVMRRFRSLFDVLEEGSATPHERLIFAQARKAAAAFEQAVQIALPTTDPQHANGPRG